MSGAVGSAPDDAGLAEGVARVVAVDHGTAWLEPEPTTSCAGCLSFSACGLKSGGSSRSLVARRFPLADDQGYRVGERIVVGLPESAVLSASATAYAIPLLTMVGAGILAQGLGAGDGTGAAAILGGLAVGLLVARVVAGRLARRGAFAPRFLRRVAPGGGCGQGTGEPGMTGGPS